MRDRSNFIVIIFGAKEKKYRLQNKLTASSQVLFYSEMKIVFDCESENFYLKKYLPAKKGKNVTLISIEFNFRIERKK